MSQGQMNERKDSFVAPRCASCPFKKSERLCFSPGGKHPKDCPTAAHADMIEKSRAVYTEPEMRRFAREAARTERTSYHITEDGLIMPVRPRVMEIVDFCRRMDYHRVGLIFCIGLAREAGIVARIFEAQGLETVSAICKAGGISKSELELEDGALLCPEKPESMCNPVLQAMLMNEANVDFNVLLGLCVGHDSMALMYLKAPATVLVAKDRMLAHNPLGAINCADSYFRYMEKSSRGN